ncbi:hypothetical protein EBR25_13325, partial [bacterium]|nr:hypothetical protein [bacterium]
MTRPNNSQQNRPAVIKASRTLKLTGRSTWKVDCQVNVAPGKKPEARLRKTLKNIGGMPMDRLKVIQILHELGYELPTIEQLKQLKQTQGLDAGLYWVQHSDEYLWDSENGTLTLRGDVGKVWILGLSKSGQLDIFSEEKVVAEPVMAQAEPSVEPSKALYNHPMIIATVPNKHINGWRTVDSPIKVQTGVTPQSRLRKTIKDLGGMPTKHSQIQEILAELGYRLPTVDELYLLIPESRVVNNCYWVQSRNNCLFDPFKRKWAKISSKGKDINIL